MYLHEKIKKVSDYVIVICLIAECWLHFSHYIVNSIFFTSLVVSLLCKRYDNVHYEEIDED